MDDAVLARLGPLDLNKTDDEIGQWMVAAWVGMQAERAGIPLNRIPEEWATSLIAETAKIDSDSVEHAALESAFRKACAGDYETAGKMLRDYVEAGATDLAKDRLVGEALPILRGKRKGSPKGGATNKAKAEGWQKTCIEAAKKMLAEGRAQHELAGVLSTQYKRTATQVRNVLQDAGVMTRRTKKAKTA
ncbi:hypothetical protein GCM10027084_02370 [Pseudoxanthomonas sangjuensis]|uniref:hypothetical protein n=1 Tax=Pseudoxanthomonas sangjuensis TaxID=1503750 RepID=UPI00139131D3|nr:hypothetical protein [Pseudoxanthomonas sangjuensis]KAF1713878.1 hypothetical protein CSC71_05740 [Pseudoxanthomonas sangjuensis]